MWMLSRDSSAMVGGTYQPGGRLPWSGSGMRGNVPCRAPHWAQSDSGKTGWRIPNGSPETVTTVTARAARREPRRSRRTGRGAEPWRKNRPPPARRSSWRAGRSAARGGGARSGAAGGPGAAAPGYARPGDGAGVEGVDDDPGRAVVAGPPAPAAAPGHRREAAGGRFQEDDAEPLRLEAAPPLPAAH